MAFTLYTIPFLSSFAMLLFICLCLDTFEEAALDILNPDPNSLTYFQTVKAPGLPASSAEFLNHINSLMASTASDPFPKLPIKANDLYFKHWGQFRTSHCIVVGKSQSCSSIVTAMRLFALAPNDSRSNAEMTVNGIVDRLLDICSLALRLIRGRSEQIGTSGGDRPHYNLGIVFVGEDTARDNYLEGTENKDPEIDIVNKTPFEDWAAFYGEVPFIFGYVAISTSYGVDFKFGILDRASREFEPLHAWLNISLPSNRPIIMRYLLTILPYMIELHQKVNGNALPKTMFSTVRNKFYPACNVTIEHTTANKKSLLKNLSTINTADLSTDGTESQLIV